jgi:glycerophosphoryl diester phosphodiesterase
MQRRTFCAAIVALFVLAAAAAVAPRAAHSDDSRGNSQSESSTRFDLEGHRGTRGLRPENTLAAFGKALQTGVTTLELDTGVTKDGVVVVSHERRISSLECQDTGGNHVVGQLIKDLTYAQIQTLDCGTRHPANPATDPFVGTQESVPGTHMPKLAQVFELAKRYGAENIQFDIETKIDPTVSDTVDYVTFTQKVLAVIQQAGAVKNSLLQSFDWRTLVESKRELPELRTVALAQVPTIYPGTPWTAGVPIAADAWTGGSLAQAARSIGASVLSARFQDITDPLIAAAHQRELLIVPWTVNDAAVMRSLIDRGVDGLITDYPNIGRDVMAEKHIELPEQFTSPFDIEGHRGARAYRPENTIPAFAYALSKGVTTLELDTGVTKDGVLVVSHNRNINGVHCHDTAPAYAGDPLYPYAGKLIRDLTLAEIKTLDCGFTDPGFPMQTRVSAQMPTLQELFDYVKAHATYPVRFNIETKISPLVSDTVPYDVFTRKLVESIQSNHLEDRAMIQSFDWRTIMLSKQLDPEIETVALVWQFGAPDCQTLADECSLEAKVGDPALKSPWTGGLDWWTYQDLGKLVSKARADVVSSNWQVHDPQQGTVASSDWYAKEDPAMFHGPTISVLQQRNDLRVVPYTIDNEQTMQRVIDLGVDGIISDDVDLLIKVAKRNGLA